MKKNLIITLIALCCFGLGLLVPERPASDDYHENNTSFIATVNADLSIPINQPSTKQFGVLLSGVDVSTGVIIHHSDNISLLPPVLIYKTPFGTIHRIQSYHIGGSTYAKGLTTLPAFTNDSVRFNYSEGPCATFMPRFSNDNGYCFLLGELTGIYVTGINTNTGSKSSLYRTQ